MPSTEPKSDASNRRRTRPAWLLFTTLGVTVLACGVGLWQFMQPNLPSGVTQARFDAAAQQFQELHGTGGSHVEIVLLIGELAVAEERLEEARACFQAIPSSDSRYGPAARLQQAQVALRLNRAREAEANFREFLALAARRTDTDSTHLNVARKWLAYILSVELRIEERQVVLAELHASGQADVYDSKQLYLPHLLIWPSPVGRRKLEAFLQQDAEDPMLLVAWGRYLTAEGKPEEARVLLSQLCRQDPKNLQCTAALLEAMYEQNDWDGFAKLYKSVLPYRDFEPWLLSRLRGQYALHQKDWEQAVLEFQHVLAADPADPGAHVGLAKAFAALGRDVERDRLLQQSAVLAKMRVSLVGVNEQDAHAATALAEQCEEVGLETAARVFRMHASRLAQSRPHSAPVESDARAAL
ncbi:MAG: tetratricopeptide repeat protein [Planctomycetaceae bacterium]|nr:tetratricopeptide repeat protein [Planctomycetaceae bacterium]